MDKDAVPESRSDYEELKPCPFCGGEARFGTTDCYDNGEFVECSKCRASTYVVIPLKESAKPKLLQAWNYRASSPPAAQPDGWIAVTPETKLGGKIVDIWVNKEGGYRIPNVRWEWNGGSEGFWDWHFADDMRYSDGEPLQMYNIAPADVTHYRELPTPPAAQPDGWIAVSDRLPEPGVNVLIISMNFQTHSQHYTAYRSEPMTDDSPTFWRDSHTGAQTIFATHWCPLPTPPVQEKV